MRIAPITMPFQKTTPLVSNRFKAFSMPKDTVCFQGQKVNFKNEIENLIENDPDFPIGIAPQIMLRTNKENLPLSQIMLKDKTFPKFLIPDILKTTNKDNLDSRVDLYKFIKKRREKLGGDYKYAMTSLMYTEPYNIELAKSMVGKKRFPKNIIWSVLYFSNENNSDIANIMIQDEDFPKERIANILQVINDDNKDVARALIEKKDFPRGDMGLVLTNVNSLNSQFCLYMISEGSYGTYKIVDMLKELSY